MVFTTNPLRTLIRRQTPADFEYRGDDYAGLVRNYAEMRVAATKLLDNPKDKEVTARLEKIVTEVNEMLYGE